MRKVEKYQNELQKSLGQTLAAYESKVGRLRWPVGTSLLSFVWTARCCGCEEDPDICVMERLEMARKNLSKVTLKIARFQLTASDLKASYKFIYLSYKLVLSPGSAHFS